MQVDDAYFIYSCDFVPRNVAIDFLVFPQIKALLQERNLVISKKWKKSIFNFCRWMLDSYWESLLSSKSWYWKKVISHNYLLGLWQSCWNFYIICMRATDLFVPCTI